MPKPHRPPTVTGSTVFSQYSTASMTLVTVVAGSRPGLIQSILMSSALTMGVHLMISSSISR